MIVLLIMVGVVAAWVAKRVIASLIGQQVRGSIPDVTRTMARRAARKLPPHLADSYEEDWLAELDALENKPLTAIRFARGLSRAVRVICAESGMSLPSASYALASRLLEANLSLVLLVLLSPLLNVIAVAIKADSRGPVFYRRRRLGRAGASFDLLAFRTLEVDSDSDPLEIVTLGRFCPYCPASRTRVGRYLSRTALDALPTMINVLRGDLALIGPPPQREGGDEDALPVRPGIFSWQVLVKKGGCDLEIGEAKRRDRGGRSVRNDLSLIWVVFRFELRGCPEV